MQGLNADEAEQGIGALDEEMLQRPAIDQLWNIKAWSLACTPCSYALTPVQQLLCNCRVHCITGMAMCALLYWCDPLCMHNTANGHPECKAWLLHIIKPCLLPLQVAVYNLHRQVHCMTSILMQLKCHDVCRTTCHQQCMKPF